MVTIRRRRPTRYPTVYWDPPWPERGGGKIKRGADRHYPTMTVRQIHAFDLDRWAAPDCHLYTWTTNTYLEDALETIRLRGFRFITPITWIKDRMGLGQYYRGLTEHCLFAVRGRIPYQLTEDGRRRQGLTGIIAAPKGRHSEKPAEMRRMIEVVSPGPRIEIFARERFPGWDAWGNEV